MPLEEYLRCVDAMTPVIDDLKQQGFDPYLWLDYEPLSHPDICQIVTTTKQRLGRHFDITSFPTTGMPIANRGDWQEMLEALKAAGTREVLFTLHGPPEVHDRAMSCPGALDGHLVALRRVQECGFQSDLKLIVSRDMLKHFAQTEGIARHNGYDNVRAEVPIYEPIPRLRRFEARRATLEQVAPVRRRLSALCTTGASREYWARAEDYSEGAVLSDVLTHPERYSSFAAMEPSWLFLTVTPGLTLYHGNAGWYHREIGSLAEDSPEALVKRIGDLKPNCQFGGFYDLESLPPPIDVAKRFGDARGSRLYATAQDVLLRWLDLMTGESSLSECRLP